MSPSVDLDELARSLGVAPPPLPLSEEGQRNLEHLSDADSCPIGEVEPLPEELGAMVATAEGLITELEPPEVKRGPFVEDRERPLTPTRQTIIAMMAWADALDWAGKSGGTDLYAYLAFLGVAYRANTTYVGMSQYQLGELIGVSNKTAWRSMRRLERRGLIKREVLQDDVTRLEPHADRYSLVVCV
jgi:hypothetical protein